ncbi:MAG: poly granule associated protein [Burkholderiales bacterium PBB1]|nr:MAG: poly granule associated protein [Burkholderiales bacterium PBB1]
MVKKASTPAASPLEAAAGLFDNALAGHVKESAQQIWLAGLGAFSKAQEEGGRVFEALVQEGVTLQRKTQTVAGEKLGAVSAQLSDRLAEVGQKVEEVSAKASGQWDRLETIFEQRVAKALASLGVPHANDIRALTEQIEQLRAEVAALTPKPPSPPARKRPAARSVASPAPVAPKRRTPKP